MMKELKRIEMSILDPNWEQAALEAKAHKLETKRLDDELIQAVDLAEQLDIQPDVSRIAKIEAQDNVDNVLV